MFPASPAPDDVAFTQLHSRSYTALAALHRLGLRPRCDGVFRLLVLGADRNEGVCPAVTARVFAALRRCHGWFPGPETEARQKSAWSHASVTAGIHTIELTLVGPNVTLAGDVEADVMHTIDDDDDEKIIKLSVKYQQRLFHERQDSNSDQPFDLCLAYNAGIWGYAPHEWGPSLAKILVTQKTPIVVTGYSAGENEVDESALREMGTYFSIGHCGDEAQGDDNNTLEGDVQFAWVSERNPFRSEKPRALEFSETDCPYNETRDEAAMRENGAWLCLRPRETGNVGGDHGVARRHERSQLRR
jgi:hypothetical protein|tara:strand:- start:118 stop:1023 length:906 start_codon:yes stop_codon:yes gene_type:complete